MLAVSLVDEVAEGVDVYRTSGARTSKVGQKWSRIKDYWEKVAWKAGSLNQK